MLLVVATGTTEVVVAATSVVAVTEMAVEAMQGYVTVEVVGALTMGPTGGFLLLQLETEQLPPGQLLLQYWEIWLHQPLNWKQFKLAGKPAFRKQDAT